jgi:hypothetical protein
MNYRYILDEAQAGDIFKANPTRRVFSFPSFPTSSTTTQADLKQQINNEREQKSLVEEKDVNSGLAAEITVFKALESAAQAVAAKKPDMKFLLFHSVKYGGTGTEVDQKWESDIDVVLLCFDERLGWFFFYLAVMICIKTLHEFMGTSKIIKYRKLL